MRRAVLLAAVALVATAAGAGAVSAAPAAVSFGDVRPAFDGRVPTQTLEAYGERGMHVLAYAHGARTRVALPVRNTGPLPVTVTSVALPGPLAPLLSLGEVEGLPLRLGPGETGEVTATAVLGNCRFTHEREVELHDALRVGFRVLGRTAVREVALDRPVLVHSPMIVGCPERKLDRQAYDRSDAARAG